MMRELHKFTLENNNKHLLDLFSQNGAFLELGTIRPDVLIRLMNFELVDCEDIAYFPLLMRGLGSFDVGSEKLKKVLPFLFFERLHQKNKSQQLFITYGLLQHKDERKREIFSPIALLPVNLYLENGRIFIQQIARPIENPALLNFLKNEKDIEIARGERIDSPYALDKYCFGFEKYGFSVKLENYLTFASIKEPELKLERGFFDYDGGYPDFLSDCLYDSRHPRLYYSRRLTRKQRQAVYRAALGQNLSISGRLGTGKTTVLLNIAVNAISQGKRVLYVSNMKETLEQVKSHFEKLGLNSYMTDFTDSFANFHQGEPPEIPEDGDGADPEKLYENYRYIKKYVNTVTARILDYRFIEVVNGLARISDLPKEKLDIDDLSSLYKSEYLEILAALKKIEENLKKIGDFSKSIWNEIPVFNNIKYPNQIFALLYQVQKNFTALQEQKLILEKRFGLKPIANFAYLKSVFHDLKGLDVTAFPASWVAPEVFGQAREEFKNLKTDIYQIQELEYLLASRYEGADALDIEAEMRALYGPFFKEEDLEKIERIIKDRAELNVITNKISVQTDIFAKNRKKLATLLNWDFPLSDQVLQEISNLNEALQGFEPSFEAVALAGSENREDDLARLGEIDAELLRLEAEIESLFKEVPAGKGKKVDLTSAEVENYLAGKPLKKASQKAILNAKKENPKLFEEKLQNFKKLKVRISDRREVFKALAGFDHSEKAWENLRRFCAYFRNLEDKHLKSKFLKFLKNTVRIEEPRRRRNYRNLLDLFSKSYLLINSYYRELLDYGFKEAGPGFLSKLQDIEAISKYLDSLYSSNDRLGAVLKDREVSVSEYLELHRLRTGIRERKAALKGNTQYRHLYGKLYADYETNINNVSRFLQAFKLYSDCFDNQEKLIESLSPETNSELLEHLRICEEAAENLSEVFKIFFKIFRDSVSKYYYSSFKEILGFLEELQKAKDELICYLAVTDSLKVLSRFRLTKLIDYILALKDPDNLALNFQYTYFERLKEIYLEEHPFLADIGGLEETLEETVTCEDKLIAAFARETVTGIRRESGSRFYPLGIRNLDYSGFIRRTAGTKWLFLGDTQILNNFLNPEDFDLILVDDAHLLHANHYYKALQGRQVVVAGEQQLLSSVSENLISRVSNNKTIVLDFRFLPTPGRLLREVKGLKGLLYSEASENGGVEVATEEIEERIAALSEAGILNVFLPGIEQQRDLYEGLAERFLKKGLSEEEVLRILKERINICDLAWQYLFDADYNVLYLGSYFRSEADYEVANFLDLLMLCRRKLIIYDEKRLLESAIETKFLTELKRIISNPEISHPKEAKGAVALLSEKLEARGVKVWSSLVFSLLLEKKDRFYGVLVFWAEDNADYEILNEYRENYLLGKNLMDVFIVWSWELMESVEKTCERIIRGMNDA